MYELVPSTGLLITLAAFTGGVDGRLPAGALLLYGGLLYGTTISGGYASGGATSVLA